MKSAEIVKDAGPPRVELRRYLAGIPFSHQRNVSAEERRLLGRRLGVYLGGHVIALVIGAALRFVPDEWAGIYTPLCRAGVLVAGLVAVACLVWAMPFLSAFMLNKVDVYIGPLRAIRGFDTAQDYYLDRPELAGKVDRYVELLSLGPGDRIWRVEGVENGERLSSVRSVRVTVVPDIDERGERPLTREESEEIRLRVDEYADAGSLAGMILIAGFCLAVAVFVSLMEGMDTRIYYAIASGSLVLAAIEIWRNGPRRRFARELQGDRKVSVVRDGCLASGTPWVVDGEPARWRLGYTRGRTPRATRRSVTDLERGGRTQ